MKAKKQEGLDAPKAEERRRVVALSTGEVFDATPAEERGRYRVWRGYTLVEESSFAKRGRFKRPQRRGLIMLEPGQDPEEVRAAARLEDGVGLTEGELLREKKRRDKEKAAKLKIAKDRAARAKKPATAAPRGSKKGPDPRQTGLFE